jgi:transcriptional regulator with XRE-family HTH domain
MHYTSTPPQPISSLDPTATLAHTIRRLRRERGVSQEVLAVQSGITVSTLSHTELAKSSPSWSTIHQLLKALGVTLHQFATAIEEEEQ